MPFLRNANTHTPLLGALQHICSMCQPTNATSLPLGDGKGANEQHGLQLINLQTKTSLSLALLPEVEGCAGTGLHCSCPISGISGGSLVPAAGSSATARCLHGPRWLTMLEAFSRGCRNCSQQPRACWCPLPCSQVLGPPCSASPPHPLHALLPPPGVGSLLHA